MSGIISENKNNAALTLDEVRENIRKIVEQVIRPNADRIDRNKEFPSENIAALAKEGFNGILLPEKLGGWGLNYSAFGIAVQEIAKACPSTALIYTMHVEAARTIYAHGNEEQWERWLKPVRSGKFGTTSTSEGATGGHYWYNLSEAERKDNGYIINSQKSFTTSSGFADFYVFQTKTPNAKSPDDITYFIVDGHQEGIEPGEWSALGVRGNHSSSLRLRDVYVDEKDRLGEEGEGKEIVQNGIAYLIGLGATWTGTAIGILDETLAYAKRKVHQDVNKALSDYQIIRSQLAKAKILTAGLQAWQKDLALQLDEWLESGEKYAPEELKSSLLEFKVLASDAANEIAQIGLDVSGGFGYREGTLERLYRDARAGIAMGPSNHIAREMIGKKLVGITDDLWN
ncbi:acyl-CoA dehydrogenase [Paenibacillus naphthalenovorans]|uniref:acyl-CoA dehydrogenase family protein n=1 Tax=Paenibacillus naphthalenovorans TaxID=162209 RepID=UPI0010B6BF26|nr:acyl-CoA dehydrogenase family protein [Paenibacillus naphthalenovorans]GCL73183.1 acyl-CoA dehydrogenase [Paenibacillus naphthalenovorans]